MLSLRKKLPKKIRTASKERVYAIGDVHGRHDLLKLLLKKIVKHWESSDGQFSRVKMIFLGDIIDRGPMSRECLELVESLVRKSKCILILGNHEDLLLRSIEGDEDAQRIWLENGGEATLESFGIAPPRHEEDGIDFGDRLAKAIPQNLRTLMKEAPTHVESGDYFFVHAGVRPGIALSKQSDYDKFFIRNEFTESKDWHGAVVVHGHSIVENVELRPNRIAVDTGAFQTGKLSCICLDGLRRQVIST